MVMGFMTKIRKFFTTSSRLHVRGASVASLSEAVNVIDKFLDGKLSFELEWDDFVSWENENPGIEKIRLRIADLERDFFSSQQDVRRSAVTRLVSIRNEVAAIAGLPARDGPQQ